MARLKVAILGFLGFWLLRALFALNRKTVINGERWEEILSCGRPILICCWHGRLLFPVFRWRREGTHALAGLHMDAEIISKIATKLGWRMLRGSSSIGGEKAYKQLLETLEKGGKVFITPDGPRGPEHELKEGTVKSAKRTNALLVPLSGQASRRWEIRNWDTFVVPKPFGRMVHVVGEPIDVMKVGGGKKLSKELQRAMNRVERDADSWIAKEI